VFKFNNLSSLQIFQLLRYSTFLLISIGFAKLHLAQTHIGQFETFLMVSGMLSFFWVSGIINSMLAIYPKKSSEQQGELLFNTFLSLVIAGLLVGALLLAFSGSLMSFLHRDGGPMRLIALYIGLNCPSFLVEYILFLNNRRNEIMVYGMLMLVITLPLAVLPVVLGYPIEYAMWGLIFASALKLVYAFILLSRYSVFNFNAGIQLESIKLSMPLILSIFVSGSAEYIDGIIVKSKFDNVFFAVYRYGAKELPVLLIIANTLSSAMIPAVAANLENGLKEIKEKSLKLMHFFFPLTMVLLIISPWLYRFVFSESFVYSALIFNIYLLLIIPRVLFPQTILTGAGKPQFLLISSILEIIINVTLSVYLAGIIGLPGIAVGTFVAYTFDKLFLMAVNYFVYGIPPSQYVKLTPYVVYVILTFVCFVFGFAAWKNL
jgi:O-antigen/teichoic acid export membrane protein